MIASNRSPRAYSARALLAQFPSGGAAIPLAPGYHLSRLRRSFHALISRFRISTRLVRVIVALAVMLAGVPCSTEAKGDDFGAAVKIIEQFYNVKHKSLPFLARAGMKVATTAARISGGDRKRIAEVGSVKVAFFEGQDFSSRGRVAAFRSSINSALLNSWSPLVQTLSAKDEEQTYIYLRQAKEKLQVLVVTIDRHDAVVVQATINPNTLAKLMQNPDEMGRAITNDATTDDN